MDHSTMDLGFAPPSPTVSDRSLIFERDVQEDPLLLPAGNSGSSNCCTRSNSTLIPTLATKLRSNSAVSMSSCSSATAVNGSSRLASPVQQYDNNNNTRRLSRANSYSTTVLVAPLTLSPVGSSSNSSSTANTATATAADNHHHHHRRRTMENSVAPALDASCSLLADNSADLDNVNVIHSRSSSTIGLDMALGNIRSYSNSTSSIQNEHTSDDNEDGNNNESDDNTKTLKFYSYNDMLTDELTESMNASPIMMKRPSLITSYSTSLLKSPSIQQQQQQSTSLNTTSPPHKFLNPFNARRGSSPYLSPNQNSRRYSNNTNPNGSGILSKSPTSVPATNFSQNSTTDTLSTINPLASNNNSNIPNNNIQNINNQNYSSILLQDPSSNVNIRKQLRNSIISMEKNKNSPQFGSTTNNSNNICSVNLRRPSKFHILQSDNDTDTEDENDDEENAVCDSDDHNDNNESGQIVSTIPISRTRGFSNNSLATSSPFTTKRTTFLDSSRRSNSIVQLQQYTINSTILLNDKEFESYSPSLDNYQLQTEKLSDVIRERASNASSSLSP